MEYSYPISAPMVNEVTVLLLWRLFGLNVTAIYIGFEVLLAIATGYLHRHFHHPHYQSGLFVQWAASGRVPASEMQGCAGVIAIQKYSALRGCLGAD
jgi:uncharacterized membrane protein YraQ (UPF0718 family)